MIDKTLFVFMKCQQKWRHVDRTSSGLIFYDSAFEKAAILLQLVYHFLAFW